MSDYTPTDEDVFRQYKALAERARPLGVTYTQALRARGDEYRRWLAAHDREVAARALEDFAAGLVVDDPGGAPVDFLRGMDYGADEAMRLARGRARALRAEEGVSDV